MGVLWGCMGLRVDGGEAVGIFKLLPQQALSVRQKSKTKWLYRDSENTDIHLAFVISLVILSFNKLYTIFRWEALPSRVGIGAWGHEGRIHVFLPLSPTECEKLNKNQPLASSIMFIIHPCYRCDVTSRSQRAGLNISNYRLEWTGWGTSAWHYRGIKAGTEYECLVLYSNEFQNQDS